ncbi:MAG: prephenate dehydrogenase/arogenate dehydrogenase family protein [Clostridia bacterium]|nr:prephenate dehydrogenase/arogenate dehydrogenase family protein [Clostridia bacterium]
MKVIVNGLGIIGGSICAALKKAGHTVYGKNRNKQSIAYALEHNMIDDEARSYDGADAIILALPPSIVMHELDCGNFPSDVVVADICGVKEPLEKIVLSRQRDYRYVGLHPMAGKETTGITSASANLFRGANLIFTVNEQTDKAALNTMRRLGKDMGFLRFVECSARRHDEMIALTSQLAHVVSNAYVKSPFTEICMGFTGGSYQDMTRIAGMDETVWSELFFLNRENLIDEIERLRRELGRFSDILSNGDEEELQALIVEGKDFYTRFKHKN